jgi:hypothetical protein
MPKNIGSGSNSPQEEEERDKKILLWSGISFFMVMIVILWSFNIKSTFCSIERDQGASHTSAATEQESIDDIVEEIKGEFESVKEAFEEQEREREDQGKTDDAREYINKLKQNLQEEDVK